MLELIIGKDSFYNITVQVARHRTLIGLIGLVYTDFLKNQCK
jgi:hypothetical protein